MKVNFNFDTGARRIRLLAEDVLEKAVLAEMAYLQEKGVTMQLRAVSLNPDGSQESGEAYEIEMRINGFDKEKKAE